MGVCILLLFLGQGRLGTAPSWSPELLALISCLQVCTTDIDGSTPHDQASQSSGTA